MGNVNALLSERFKKKEQSSKMTEMAKQSASGNLTTFSGLFSVVELNEKEKEHIEAILNEYTTGNENINRDLNTLISITAEVKAINNQAAILHGERVKKAHTILTKYRDGAFTAWMIAAYGNRQTPYNLMQYYEFYQAMPTLLKTQLDTMPRQAVYTLASREGSLEKKQKIVESYNGQTKTELLTVIRQEFPLSKDDKRQQNIGESTIISLKKVCNNLKRTNPKLSKTQKRTIFNLLDQIQEIVNDTKSR